jgi:hypothetical protein
MSSNETASRRPDRARVTAVAAGSAVWLAAAAAPLSLAATDLAAVQAVPQRGQSADQTRRDRYECHNWAVEQAGVVPPRVEPGERAAADRAERIDRVITGAGVGAAVGGVVRATQDENPSHGVLSGGAIGAVVGALIGRRKNADEPDPEFDAYFRALSACLEGRGYQVVIAGAPASAAAEASAAAAN